ncbi:hypothetical protein GJ699_14355 [Duganella sp. FT80W]|uniref:RiboL-PSP-HEPN domain-containing protein n=1 Tax=Duganella guangzhouensis TaxID=2666084 RepID=A0A6I2L2X0_9BURK|nr:hypothetical protein [Duganella guangzhouensis]MRW91174.1 hypothetical protein [Duganella guangzhouensis]
MGRTKELMYEMDDELDNLPEEAFELWGSRAEIEKYWFSRAGSEEQKIAMYGWFKRNFYYPGTLLLAGARNNHIYAEGGPYSPKSEIASEFGAYTGEDILQQVIRELEEEGVTGWALIPEYVDDGDYDELLDVDVSERAAPKRDLEMRLNNIVEMLQLTGSEAAKTLNIQLAFAATITALESFLWESVSYAVEHDEMAVRRIIKKVPHFNEQKLGLGEIFERHDGIRTLVKSYLQDTVWHKAETAGMLLKISFDIRPPSFARFAEAVIKRHDIVHRSSRTKDGEQVIVTSEEIQILMNHVRDFASELMVKLDERQLEVAMENATARLKAVGEDLSGPQF